MFVSFQSGSKVLRFIYVLLSFGALAGARADLWRTGYYPGWEQDDMPPSAIDYSVLTHIIHFSAVPNTNATLNTSVNTLSAGKSSAIVASAHAAGRKVLVCIGGGGSGSGFEAATGPTNVGAFVTNIVNLMTSRGYDGVDIDWEPLGNTNFTAFTNFIVNLRTKLDTISPRPLLTAAIAAGAAPMGPTPATMVAAFERYFDQINLMTYDLSGPYGGWVTWFNSAIYDGGYRFPSTGALIPSCDGMVKQLAVAGVPLSKLGLGMAFYGQLWTGGAGTPTGGVTAPRQGWTTNVPAMTALSYNTIMSTRYQPALYHWDVSAQAAWLGFDSTNSASDWFLSYDDERMCEAKVSYARNNRMGGIMIWEIAQDHHNGVADPLLSAIKSALATPGTLSISTTGTAVDLSFTSMPLGSYAVQWRTNLASGSWNNLTITNVTGSSTGGVLHVLDTNPFGQPRFFRVQSPP